MLRSSQCLQYGENFCARCYDGAGNDCHNVSEPAKCESSYSVYPDINMNHDFDYDAGIHPPVYDTTTTTTVTVTTTDNIPSCIPNICLSLIPTDGPPSCEDFKKIVDCVEENEAICEEEDQLLIQAWDECLCNDNCAVGLLDPETGSFNTGSFDDPSSPNTMTVGTATASGSSRRDRRRLAADQANANANDKTRLEELEAYVDSNADAVRWTDENCKLVMGPDAVAIEEDWGWWGNKGYTASFCKNPTATTFDECINANDVCDIIGFKDIWSCGKLRKGEGGSGSGMAEVRSCEKQSDE